MAIFAKELTSYLARSVDATERESSDEPPGTTFLREVVDLCDAIHHCKRWFARKQNGDFTKDSADSFERIVTATFALLMSHFETFQKHQFARLVDASFMFEGPDVPELARRLEKEGCTISLQRVLVGAGEFGEVGEIVADALPGWHRAERVNSYFRTIFQDFSLYSNHVARELNILWQLRHSVVHTGGVIIRADAIKVEGLKSYGNRRLVFGEEFMSAIGRRFHIMVEVVLQPLRQKVVDVYTPLEDESDEDTRGLIHSLVGFSSSRNSWFRNQGSP